MNYLYDALKWKAKNIVILMIHITSLFKALEDYYDNKRIMVHMHIRGIINYEKFSQESAKIFMEINRLHKKEFKSSEGFIIEWDCLSNALLLNIIVQKWNHETCKKYELTLNIKDIPECDNFFIFSWKTMPNFGKYQLQHLI